VSARFRPLVLCYHRVSRGEPHQLAVSPEQLERHLRGLMRRGYRPAGAGGVIDGSPRAFHVTFDDAFRSVAEALPALERVGAPATVFACSGMADEGLPLRVPELEQLVEAAPAEFATMRWDELRELAERGVEIGAHTVSHPRLTRLGDVELERELRESRERTADELRRPCRYFAYPYGDEDARVRDAVRRAGYEAAFALPGRRAPIDRFALPRVDLYWKDTGLRAALKVSPLFWLVARARERAGAIAPARREKAGGG
jgi:peptidoglycan/xylan/chitin deacetylase (PgdA/CDA1 family)